MDAGTQPTLAVLRIPANFAVLKPAGIIKTRNNYSILLIH
jgi:hypothetical protein